jgi:serine/threonine-protein kinase
MQSLRDASVTQALTSLQQAAQADPDAAAAQLQLLAIDGDASDEVRRQRLAAVTRARSRLGERDAALLDAVRATVPGGDALDVAEIWRRWSALVEAYPGDAELQVLFARIADATDHEAAVEPALERAIVLDPKFAWPYAVQGERRLGTGDLDAALQSCATCLRVSPVAATCMRLHSEILTSRGQCRDLEKDARANLAIEPDGWRAYHSLAVALLNADAAPEAIQVALRKEAELQADPAERARTLELVDMMGGVVRGDMAPVARAMDEVLGKSSAASTDSAFLSWHFGGAVLVHQELGDVAGAADVADAFMRRRASFSTAAWPWIVGWLLAAQLDAHHVTRAEYAQRLASEMRADEATSGAMGAWMNFVVFGVRDEASAKAALASIPDGQSTAGTNLEGWAVGRTYRLAGRLDEAVPRLRAAVAACLQLDASILFHHWASEELGEALEQQGDKGGACAAYDEVLSRWGHASSPSVTVAKARAHAKKLGCPEP